MCALRSRAREQEDETPVGVRLRQRSGRCTRPRRVRRRTVGGRRAHLAAGMRDALTGPWPTAREALSRPCAVPDLYTLTAEVDAATVRLDDPASPADLRDYVLGAHDALAWLCGHTDQRPLARKVALHRV